MKDEKRKEEEARKFGKFTPRHNNHGRKVVKGLGVIIAPWCDYDYSKSPSIT
jgi:hypothetical protein